MHKIHSECLFEWLMKLNTIVVLNDYWALLYICIHECTHRYFNLIYIIKNINIFNIY
jgi:hypothetical protein